MNTPDLTFENMTSLGPQGTPRQMILTNDKNETCYMTPFVLRDKVYMVVGKLGEVIGARVYELNHKSVDSVLDQLDKFFNQNTSYDIVFRLNEIIVKEHISTQAMNVAKTLLEMKNGVFQQTSSSSGGASTKKKTSDTIVIHGKKYTIYQGPRGGKYIKRSGKFVPV